VFYALVLIAASASPCAFRPDLQLVPALSPVRVVRVGYLFNAAATLTLSARTLRKAAPVKDAGLRAHVAGYYAIARKLAQASALRANAGSQAEARVRLARAAAQLVSDANAEYARESRIYDAVTENGRAQSQGPAYGFPGGPNADVYCMR